MYKKILVPLDGSRRSEKILPHVEALVQRYGAKVFFFRVVGIPQLTGYSAITIEKYRENCEKSREEAHFELDNLAALDLPLGEELTDGIEFGTTHSTEVKCRL